MRGRPVSRILSRELPLMDDHSSDDTVAGAAIAANPDLLGQKQPCPHTRRSGDTRSLFGIAPGGACHAVRVATNAVGSYPAVSPLPSAVVSVARPAAKAVYFLWRCPSGCPVRALPGTVSFWSPDFPRPCCQNRGHPAFRAWQGRTASTQAASMGLMSCRDI